MRLRLRSLFLMALFQISLLTMLEAGEQSLVTTNKEIKIDIFEWGIGVSSDQVPEALYRLETNPYLTLQVFTLKDALSSANGRIVALQDAIDASELMSVGLNKYIESQKVQNRTEIVKVAIISTGVTAVVIGIAGFILGVVVAK